MNNRFSIGYSYLQTSMATSGQDSAQSAQPVHSFSAGGSAGQKPWLLTSLLKTISSLGQANVQRAQALHRSRLMIILPMAHSTSTLQKSKRLNLTRTTNVGQVDFDSPCHLQEIGV
jgi:hypothetical protein